MTGEELFAALGEIGEEYLADVDISPVSLLEEEPPVRPKAEPVKKKAGRKRFRWKGVLASAACLALLAVAVALVPLIIGSGHQLGTSDPTVAQAGGAYGVEEHIHVIFRSLEKIDELLLMEYEGEELQNYLKEEKLWNQGVRTREDVAWLAELIRSTPMPMLNDQAPTSVEILSDKYLIHASFEGLSVSVDAGVFDYAIPEGAVQISEEPMLYLTGQLEMTDGSYTFHMLGSAHNHRYTATIRAKNLEEALETMKKLKFRSFDVCKYSDGTVSGMLGLGTFWSFDSETGILRVYPKGYTAILMGEKGAVEAQLVENKGIVHGNYAPWAAWGEEIRQVVIEQGVQKLGRNVFRDLPNLQTLSLPTTLTFIGSGNFQNCDLECVTVPVQVNYLGEGFARGNAQLQAAVFRSTRWETPGGILEDCPNLKYVQWAGTAEQWSDAVQSLPQLKEASVFCAGDALAGDEGWNPLGDVSWRYDEETKTLAVKGSGRIRSSFSDPYPWYELRSEVKHLVLGEGITGTDTNVFPFTKLQDVYLPASLVDMGNLLLAECRDLEYAILPEHADTLPNALFWGCKMMKFVAIPASVTNINSSAFNDCRMLETVRLPAGVKFIGDSAFFGCSSLREIRLPASLQQVRTGVFSGCGKLEKLHIPVSVKLLDRVSFDGCDSLTDIYYDGTREQWERVNINAYARLPEAVTVHCAETDEPAVPLIDTWIGEFRNGTWSLEHRVSAHSDVKLSVVELTVSHDADTHFGSEGYITLMLESEVDQTVELRLLASQSSDNLSTMLSEVIPIEAGQKTQNIPLRFEGWSAFSYEVCIEAGNTRIIFTIYPPEEA